MWEKRLYTHTHICYTTPIVKLHQMNCNNNNNKQNEEQITTTTQLKEEGIL